MDFCFICKNQITDEEYGESCNFLDCNNCICERCDDKIIYKELTYGWVCLECN